jgi:hypothetical protein
MIGTRGLVRRRAVYAKRAENARPTLRSAPLSLLPLTPKDGGEPCLQASGERAQCFTILRMMINQQVFGSEEILPDLVRFRCGDFTTIQIGVKSRAVRQYYDNLSVCGN